MPGIVFSLLLLTNARSARVQQVDANELDLVAQPVFTVRLFSCSFLFRVVQDP